MKISILFILAILLSLASLKYFSVPYMWISLSWLSCFVFAFFISQTSTHKFVFCNSAFLCLLLALLEAFSWIKPSTDGKRNEGTYAQAGYNRSDDMLGYAPVKGKTVTSIKYKGKEKLYGVTYTIGDNGQRISPSSDIIGCNQSVVFFGDSFTFGEGVEDNEAMPYVVSKLSNYKVYNFGFHGYGPHQMLSALEHGLVDRIVDCKPSVAIYQALAIHAARSAGLSPWDSHGPKYTLLPNGILKYDGRFDEANSTIAARLEGQIQKSFIIKKYYNIWRYKVDNDANVSLFLEIVDTSRKIFTNKYPGSSFHVIFWDNHDELVKNEYCNVIINGLRKKGIDLDLISNILPDYSAKPSTYEIPQDGHPNALAHRRIAQYVMDKILPGEPTTGF